MSDSDQNVQSDYEFSRATYYDLIMKGREALDGMMEVAASTEHPRAYEVLGTIMKNVSDVNDKLMDLNKKKEELEKTDDKVEGGVTNNNLFVGSTADIQRLILDQQMPIEAKVIEKD
jgi:hypothetical protein